MDNNCFVSSKVPIADGLGNGIGLCVNCDPGALLCELFEPTDDVDADSETSLLPFYKNNINKINKTPLL